MKCPMNFEKQFAEVIKLSEKLREESFDHVMAYKLGNGERYPDFSKCYKLTVYEATEMAVERSNFDACMIQPIYLLNQYLRDNIQTWVDKILND